MPSDERERRATLTPRAAVDQAHVQFLAGFPMNNAVATLDLVDRIAGAFRDAPASSDIAILITEVEAASLSSKEAAERARERAIDPALSAEECCTRSPSNGGRGVRPRSSGRRAAAFATAAKGVARGRGGCPAPGTLQFVGTPICSVNRSLLATAVSHFLTVTHNPG